MKRQTKKEIRENLNLKSRLLKRKKKHKGHASGSRFNLQDENQSKATTTQTDPRIGSKKPISLYPNEAKSAAPVHLKDNPLSQHQLWMAELEELENNPKLNSLLDLLETEPDALDKHQQNELDEMLKRIDKLLTLLGLNDSEDDDIDPLDDEIEQKEDIMRLLKTK